MKYFIIFILISIVSCQERKTELVPGSKTDKDSLKQLNAKFDYQAIQDASYDISNLKKIKDTSLYLFRLRYHPPFNTKSILEISPLSNGVNLSIKQPVVGIVEYTVKPENSLLFNQLVYWYADDDAKEILEKIAPFSTGKIETKNYCAGCLDKTYLQIEVYDHGKYSSFTTDSITENDWKLTEYLFAKVQLSKSNKYQIRY